MDSSEKLTSFVAWSHYRTGQEAVLDLVYCVMYRVHLLCYYPFGRARSYRSALSLSHTQATPSPSRPSSAWILTLLAPCSFTANFTNLV